MNSRVRPTAGTATARYFAIKDLKARTGLSASTILRATVKLSLTTVTVGRRRLWPIEQVEKLDSAILANKLRALPRSQKLPAPNAIAQLA